MPNFLLPQAPYLKYLNIDIDTVKSCLELKS